jgi:hypothetical protein
MNLTSRPTTERPACAAATCASAAPRRPVRSAASTRSITTQRANGSCEAKVPGGLIAAQLWKALS